MKTTLALLLATITWLAALPAYAGPIAEIQTTLTTTRQHTMAMLGEADRTVLEMRYDEALASSKALDAQLAAALANDKLRAMRPTLTQFEGVWVAFKKTRDEEIIPALYAGDRDKARGMAKTIQAPRFKKLNELLGSLPQ